MLPKRLFPLFFYFILGFSLAISFMAFWTPKTYATYFGSYENDAITGYNPSYIFQNNVSYFVYMEATDSGDDNLWIQNVTNQTEFENTVNLGISGQVYLYGIFEPHNNEDNYFYVVCLRSPSNMWITTYYYNFSDQSLNQIGNEDTALVSYSDMARFYMTNIVWYGSSGYVTFFMHTVKSGAYFYEYIIILHIDGLNSAQIYKKQISNHAGECKHSFYCGASSISATAPDLLSIAIAEDYGMFTRWDRTTHDFLNTQYYYLAEAEKPKVRGEGYRTGYLTPKLIQIQLHYSGEYVDKWKISFAVGMTPLGSSMHSYFQFYSCDTAGVRSTTEIYQLSSALQIADHTLDYQTYNQYWFSELSECIYLTWHDTELDTYGAEKVSLETTPSTTTYICGQHYMDIVGNEDDYGGTVKFYWQYIPTEGEIEIPEEYTPEEEEYPSYISAVTVSAILIPFLFLLVPSIMMSHEFGTIGGILGLSIGSAVLYLAGLLPIWVVFLIGLGIVLLIFYGRGRLGIGEGGGRFI